MVTNVTVIVPVHNTEVYINKCIDSILNQTYDKFYLILVDDGSTDCSGKICDDYEKHDSRVQVIHKKNEGLICARIDGAKKARTEYIVFVDSDDWVEPVFLEILIENQKKFASDIVISGCIEDRKGISKNIINCIASGHYEGTVKEGKIYPKMLHYEGFYEFGIRPYMWNKLFKKEILLRCYQSIDTRIYDGEDVALVYPYLLMADKITIIDDCLYHYNIHENSMTARKKPNFYQNVSRLYLNLYENFSKTEYFDIMLPQLDQYMRMMIWAGAQDRFIEASKHYFPFGKIPKDARVILYGAGNAGKALYHQIYSTEYCEIVAWVDGNYEADKLQQMGVQSPQCIRKEKYDYIVIAVENPRIQKEIFNHLSALGADRDKVVLMEEPKCLQYQF